MRNVNLIGVRVELGYTQIDVQEKSNNIHQAQLSKYECGVWDPQEENRRIIFDFYKGEYGKKGLAFKCTMRDLFPFRLDRVRLEKLKPHRAISLEEIALEDLTTAPDTRLDFTDSIQRFLSFLSPVERAIIEKQYFEGMSLREIEEEMDFTYERVRQLGDRALMILEGHLTGAGYHVSDFVRDCSRRDVA